MAGRVASGGPGKLKLNAVPIGLENRLLRSKVEAPVVHSVVGCAGHVQAQADFKLVVSIRVLVVSELCIHSVPSSRRQSWVSNSHLALVKTIIGINEGLVVLDVVSVSVESSN